jgi:UDP-glucose 4-epimerase
MKILVTGSSGTIGTRLCEALLAKGESVIGLDRVPNKWKKEVQAITTVADLLDEHRLEKLPDDIDTIVHLAANARVYELVQHPERARENMVTLWNTIEFARKRGIKRFLFASSREVYGNSGDGALKEEDIHLERIESPYTASKLAGEATVHAFSECYGIEYIIFRFSNVYGMYDDSERVVPLFIRDARAGKPLTVFGEEKCLDFTYTDDTVAGIMRALEKFDAAKNDTYNIATGHASEITELAEKVKSLTGSDSPIAIEESRTGEILRFTADISKARKKLGYEPTVSFEEGIKKAVQWYQRNT